MLDFSYQLNIAEQSRLKQKYDWATLELKTVCEGCLD